MKKRLAVLAALAVSAAAVAAQGAHAVENNGKTGPLTLHVICVELLVDAPKVEDMIWSVHFGYSTTAPVSAEEVKKSEFEDAPGWNVESGQPPEDFETTGFEDTEGATVEAIVAQNEAGSGDESITWDVDLTGPKQNSPSKARFDGDSMGPSSCPEGTAALVVSGDGTLVQGPVRAIYCAGVGNIVNGVAVVAGSALNLLLGQPLVDPNYQGATLAIFVEGIGATCDPPPAGFSFDGSTLVDGSGQATGLQNAVYAFYKKS